ncbi:MULTISPECIES: class I SAM-dependent methyltransferase [unclassified Spirosoma]|uniref:class I SAM-dependent methyltransferase n=1 Tax=unclassified Spirosoma TaxID=2621999 RepID=UPI00095F40A2|nr:MULTISPECIES: class I SAM-dependent methyltransferase [unclassified Spirosoma]MBN8823720.1 methyltransferase domain-containing protein [Spirosoma sp.]OJW76733.1 MAG: methyltransferase type 12 [Spirosoma sp. 48-14]
MAWYHNFFHGLPQEAWKAAQTEEQTQFDLELLVDTLEFGPGDQLLDVFCGYGRHALPLARMGAYITGIDISSEYVTEIQAVAKAEKLPITAIAADFLTIPASKLGNGNTFDAAYCLGNSFSFFPQADMLTFLSQIAGLLKPGGRFLAHSEMVAESVLPDYQARNWLPIETVDGDPILFMIENDYVPLEGRIDSHLTYVKGGVVQTRLAQHYVYTLAQLRHLFTEAGFQIIDCYGTVTGDPFALGDEAVWILAEK